MYLMYLYSVTFRKFFILESVLLWANFKWANSYGKLVNVFGYPLLSKNLWSFSFNGNLNVVQDAVRGLEAKQKISLQEARKCTSLWFLGLSSLIGTSIIVLTSTMSLSLAS